MNLNKAKELVIKAGLELVNSGLIARTWGNVSCRVDENTFVITPSGRNYKSLKLDEIVEVKIEDLSYKGNIKPSSEKRIHREVYKLYPHINFVIHTHQEYASIISTTNLDFISLNNQSDFIHNKIICAKYSLPGTKSLSKNVTKALKESKNNVIIMKNHGAICFGKNYEEAFKTASNLEKTCKSFIENKYLNLSKNKEIDLFEMSLFALSNENKNNYNDLNTNFKRLFNFIKKEHEFIINKEGQNIKLFFKNLEKNISQYAKTHHSIFKYHKNTNVIIFDYSPEVLAVSYTKEQVKPLLDDYAQLCGDKIITVNYSQDEIIKALKKSPVVFVRNIGALCCGKNKEEAESVRIVMKKNCKAIVGASLFGKIKPINKFECKLMRFVYLNKYSKKA